MRTAGDGALPCKSQGGCASSRPDHGFPAAVHKSRALKRKAKGAEADCMPSSITLAVSTPNRRALIRCTCKICAWSVLGKNIHGSGIDYFKVLPTADVNAPLALALVVMFFVTYYTIANHGILGFLKEFINPIELVGYFSKHVALALRLYGNLFAGEMIFILIGIMFGQFLMSFGQTLWFFPGLIMNLAWALFHILIIALQAYIFMMLTIAYINLACAKH